MPLNAKDKMERHDRTLEGGMRLNKIGGYMGMGRRNCQRPPPLDFLTPAGLPTNVTRP